VNTKQGGLITQLRDTLVHRRTDHTKEKDDLLTELIDHLGKFTDGADISSVLHPPHEAEDSLASLVAPGQWFYCKFDEDHIDHAWLPTHHKDHIVVGFHGTSVARALEIAKVGVMEAGPGQSGGRKDVVYFFETKDQRLCNFYQLYSFIDDTSPYLWTACLDAMINRNPHHGAGKLNKQRTQPPNTICLMGIHFGAVHVKELFEPTFESPTSSAQRSL